MDQCWVSCTEWRKTTTPKTEEHVLTFDQARFNLLQKSRKILVTGSFDTNLQSAKPIWLYSEYGLDLTIAAIVKID